MNDNKKIERQRLTIFLKKDEHHLIKSLAVKHQKSITTMVKEALYDYLKKIAQEDRCVK